MATVIWEIYMSLGDSMLSDINQSTKTNVV